MYNTYRRPQYHQQGNDFDMDPAEAINPVGEDYANPQTMPQIHIHQEFMGPGGFVGITSFTKPLGSISAPAPKHLDDPAAFTGPNAPTWEQIKPDFYRLTDPQTGQQQLVTMRARVMKPIKSLPNFGFPKSVVRKATIKGKKVVFDCGRPGDDEDLDENFAICMDRLEALTEDFRNTFPCVQTMNSAEVNNSFLSDRDGTALVRLQQPLAEEDLFLYGFDMDPDYASFCANRDIPDDCQVLDIPVHLPTDKKEKQGKSKSSESKNRKFRFNPVPMYEHDDKLIKPQDAKDKLSNQEVEITFGMCYTVKKGVKQLDWLGAFIGRLKKVKLVYPSAQKPEGGVRVKRKARGRPKKNVTAAAPSTSRKRSVKHEGNSDSSYELMDAVLKPKGKGKRQSGQDDDEDYEEVPNSKGKRKVGDQPQMSDIQRPKRKKTMNPNQD